MPVPVSQLLNIGYIAVSHLKRFYTSVYYRQIILELKEKDL